MKAMILAAGAGTRLKPLTNKIPKPMLPIIEKPVIEFIIELLARHEIREIMINISHLGWVMQNYLKSGYRYGVRIGYSFEGHFEKGQLVAEPVGSAGGMRRIQDSAAFFDETFIVVCGDAVIDFDLKRALDFHNSRGSIATILTKEVPDEQVSNYGIVVSDSQGRVGSFKEKPPLEKAGSNMANTGIYIFEPAIFKYIPSGMFYDIGSQLLPDLVKRKESVYSFTAEIDWFDIGRNSDYLSILGHALLGKIKGFKPSGKEITSGLWKGISSVVEKTTRIITPVFIGANTRIEKNVRLEDPAMVGSNCEICEGADLSNVFVGDYTRIKAGFKGKNILITPDFFIKSDGSTGLISEGPYAEFISDTRNLDIR